MSDEEVCRYCSRFQVHLPLSKERRKFIIVVTFDSVLITSLWILCTVKKGGENWMNDFLAEVNLLDPHFLETSLFDLALLANVRVMLLLFFYVVLRCQHWMPVAFCTTGSTLYAVAKIFLFFGQRRGGSFDDAANFQRHGGGLHDGVPHYFLILASIFVAWFELWLMPFRVLNAEHNNYAYHRHRSSPSADSVEGGEQLITPQMSSSKSPQIIRAVALTSSPNASQIYPSSVHISEDEFHSAVGYSSSDDELPEKKDNGGPLDIRIGQILCNKSLDLAEEARLKAKNLLEDAPNWKVINAKSPTIRFENALNNYYVYAELSFPPKHVFDAVWWKTQSWNHNVREFRVLNKINASTDIAMSVSMPALGGYIAERHFVDVRTYDYDCNTNVFFGVYTSVKTPGHINIENGIWGKNGVNAMRVGPIAADSATIKFEWLVNTDLQGAIPRVLMRRTMSAFLCDYVHSLEQFLRNNSGDTDR